MCALNKTHSPLLKTIHSLGWVCQSEHHLCVNKAAVLKKTSDKPIIEQCHGSSGGAENSGAGNSEGANVSQHFWSIASETSWERNASTVLNNEQHLQLEVFGREGLTG